MDSEIQRQDGAQEVGRSSLHEVLAALEEMEQQSQANHPDETVQWAINELSDEGHSYVFGPRRKVLDAYKAWKAAPQETSELARDAMASSAAPHGWAAVCDENMPPMDEIVWLYDGRTIWIGGRADDCDGWLWGNTYGSIWHNGVKWDGDLETDDEYKPTHWRRLPEPPYDTLCREAGQKDAR